jgi:4'-phosphopantetheinyl transferase
MKDQCAWLLAPDSNFKLSSDEIHVWRIALEPDENVFEKLYTVLSADERQRAGLFKFEKLKNRFIVARGALRDILSRYLDCPAGTIALEYESHGKPKLAAAMNQNKICFNLSHAEELALCAVSRECPIGVDVEYVRPLADAEKIAKRFFSPLESAAFCALPDEQKPAAFFNCWTRKEAFIKALGEGLSHPLHRFDVSFLDSEPVALLNTRPDSQEALKWTLLALAPAENYTGALAVRGKGFRLQCWQWQPLQSSS